MTGGEQYTIHDVARAMMAARRPGVSVVLIACGNGRCEIVPGVDANPGDKLTGAGDGLTVKVRIEAAKDRVSRRNSMGCGLN